MVTQPDRPAGRGMELTAPPVKGCAAEAGLDVVQPERVRDPAFAAWLAERSPDVCIVVAYGKILPGELLGIPRLGFVNVHFSVLPEYRGAAPVQRAILDGRSETGVSIMVLTEGMDEGPVLAARTEKIREEDTAGSLGARLAEAGAGLLVKILPRYDSGDILPAEQDHARATYAPRITSEDARVDWKLPARRIRDLVRGLNPAPGAWTTFRGRRLKLHRVELVEDSGTSLDLAPGHISVSLVGGDLVAGTGDVPLRIVEAQLAGKTRMTGADLARGLRSRPGEVLE